MTTAALRVDYHVHSTFSDDAVSTPQQNLDAAVAAGLETVRFIDHVRASTTWVPEFLAAVASLDVPAGLEVLTGVETKLMTTHGDLDLPIGPHGDAVVIADHQFPGPDAPWSPTETRDRLAGGLSVDAAIEQLITAYVRAMERAPGNQLAHPFSILPKVGLAESDIAPEQLERWARVAAETSTLIEVNEKWACPGVGVIGAVRDAGATLVAATDSHVASDVGKYQAVAELLAQATP